VKKCGAKETGWDQWHRQITPHRFATSLPALLQPHLPGRRDSQIPESMLQRRFCCEHCKRLERDSRGMPSRSPASSDVCRNNIQHATCSALRGTVDCERRRRLTTEHLVTRFHSGIHPTTPYFESVSCGLLAISLSQTFANNNGLIELNNLKDLISTPGLTQFKEVTWRELGGPIPGTDPCSLYSC
jgi:hypothetical protein